jgi:hypothetical protein
MALMKSASVQSFNSPLGVRLAAGGKARSSGGVPGAGPPDKPGLWQPTHPPEPNSGRILPLLPARVRLDAAQYDRLIQPEPIQAVRLGKESGLAVSRRCLVDYHYLPAGRF